MLSLSFSQAKHTMGAILLISGCCIGAGMLGLPVVSATAGFLPSILAMLLCCLFMSCTGLLLLEATLWFDKRVNLLSLADFTLGKAGRISTWLLFLSIFYCLMIAYTAGCGELVSDSFEIFFQKSIPRHVGSIFFVSLLGLLIYKGVQTVDHLNRFFMAGLIVSYCCLISLGASHIQFENLSQCQWKTSLVSIPIMLISFGYHNLVPSLVEYLRRDIQSLRIAIIAGSLIPFIIYFLWQAVILGILPLNDEQVFKAALSQSEIVTGLLKTVTESPLIVLLTNIFALFAILTSFMANAMSCIDFLADGFKWENRFRGLLCCIVLLPSLLLSLSYPHLFLVVLRYAGGLATVVLFGILPILIVWIGRYKKKIYGSYTVPGGKQLLLFLMLLSILFIGLEIYQQMQIQALPAN